MAIQGAIFDCDGTLLDSMPMWTDTCVRLLERYGVADAQAVFEAHESLDMDKKCYWYHDNLGIGQSGEALYRELWHMVEHEYRASVRPFAGCRDFLDKLAVAGIPMVVASSTPPEMLRMALELHGLLGYFDELVFAGDVGRGKEFPDVYLAACERLGTPRDKTWVFEDAPFGMRSAARVGFPVVGLLNDHDGRDEAFVKRWATVVACEYGGLSLDCLSATNPRVLRALLVAGSPEPSSAQLVASLAHEADFVVAVDKGANTLSVSGVEPNVFCGDEDSVDETAREWVHRTSDRVELHPVEKDDTDLGLAVRCAREEAERRGCALRLAVTCASGGRPDHMLGVWGLMARNADAAPRLVEDGFVCRILAREGEPVWELEDTCGATVSVVALSPHTVASEQGMRWNLDHKELELLSDMGVSNRVVDSHALITCHTGVIAVFVCKQARARE